MSVFNLEDEGFEKYLRDIVDSCDKDIQDLEFNMKTDANDIGKTFIYKNLLTLPSGKKISQFKEKDTNKVFNISIDEPLKNKLGIISIEFKGCTEDAMITTEYDEDIADKSIKEVTVKSTVKPVEEMTVKPTVKSVEETTVKPAVKSVKEVTVKSTVKPVEETTVKPTVKSIKETTVKLTVKPVVEADEIEEKKDAIKPDYIEGQEKSFCGKHALNNLFSCEILINNTNEPDRKIINNKLNLAFICSTPQEYSDFFPIEDDTIWADCDLEKGNYSAQFIGAIMYELQKMKIISQFEGPINTTEEKYKNFELNIEENLLGYLVNLRNSDDIGNHWISIKVENDIDCESKLVLYDSLEKKTICIKDDEFDKIKSRYNQTPVFFKIFKRLDQILDEDNNISVINENILPTQLSNEDISPKGFEVSFEQFIIEDIPEWNREYTDKDIVETIFAELSQYYTEKERYKTVYSINLDSNSFLDLIKKYREHDKNGVPLRKFKETTDNYSPYYELIKENRYDCIPIYPIVLNKQKYYNIADKIKNVLAKNTKGQLRNIVQSSFPELNFNDILPVIEGYVKAYKLLTANTIKYNEFMNLITNGGTITYKDEVIQLQSFTECFIKPRDDEIDYTYFNLNLARPTNLLHYTVDEEHPINLYSLLLGEEYSKNIKVDIDKNYPDIKFTKNPQHRISSSIPYTYKDQYSDTYYNESTLTKQKIQSCGGTVGTDSKYTGDNKMDDFYKSINKAPLQINSTATVETKLVTKDEKTGENIIRNVTNTVTPYLGEKVVVIGFYIPSLEQIKNFKSLCELRYDRLNIKKYPKVLHTETSTLNNNNYINENYEIIENINDFLWENVDSNKDYLVFFNKSSHKKLNQGEFKSIIEKLLPNIQDVIIQQKDKINNCKNLLEVQSVLSNYDIPINNITYSHQKELNMIENFSNNVEKVKNQIKDQKEKLDLLKKYIDTIKNIYHELLLIKWKNKNNDIHITMRNVLNNYTKLELYMFMNYYIKDQIKCIDIFEFEKIKEEDLITIVIEWFISNTSNIENLSEFYKWFFSESIEIEDEKINSLFEKYRKLFKLDKLLEFKTNGINQFDQYYMRELQLVWNLNHNYNGGRHLLQIFQLIQLIKYNKYINDLLENYSIDEYSNLTGADPSLWDKLSDDEKYEYRPSKELIDEMNKEMNNIYTKYENEREKYKNYTKCDKKRIVKVYSTLENLYKDNKKVIYYDDTFDTSKFDIEQFKKFQKQVCNNGKNIEECKELFKQNFMRKYYLFDNETELNNKIENILTNIKNPQHKSRRLIKDFELCVVINNGIKEYYQRMNNYWVPLKEKIDDINIVNTSLLSLSFKEVFLRLKETIKNSENNDEECYTIPYENIVIPKQLKENYISYITLYRKVESYEKILDFKKQINDDQNKLSIKLQEDYNYLEFILNSKNIEYDIYEEKKEDIDPSVYPPEYISDLFNEIVRIDDTDIRYTRLRDFINEWGESYNINLSTSDIKLDDNTELEEIKNKVALENENKYSETSPFHKKQLNPTTSTFFFYNKKLKDVNVPLICKHFNKLLDTAFKTNEDRKKILDVVVADWGVVEGGNYICKNCGEIIRQLDYSAMEGLDKDDRMIVFREKVIDEIGIIQFDELEIIEEKTTEDIVNIKDTIKNGLKLTDEKSIGQLEKELINTILKLFKAILSVLGLKLVSDDYVMVLKLTFNNINNVEYLERLKKFEEVIDKKVKDMNTKLKLLFEFLQIFYIERLLGALIHIYTTAIPEYKLKGTGAERKIGMGYIITNFYNNSEGAIKYFTDRLMTVLTTDTRNIIYNRLAAIIKNNNAYPKMNINIEDSAILQNASKIYNDYDKLVIIKERISLYRKYYESKEEEKNKLKKYEDWNTFAPPLKYGSNLKIEDTQSKINLSIKKSNDLLYDYFEVINNYSDYSTINKVDTKIGYIGYILFNNIRDSYLDGMINKKSEIGEIYESLRKLYYSTLLYTSDDKQTIEYILSRIKGRDLQDYMTVSKALLVDEPIEKHEEILRENIVQKWVQFNTIVYLYTDNNGELVGKRRYYKELEDSDYELIGELYGSNDNIEYTEDEIREYLYNELKKKYSLYPDDLINFKIEVIVRMNTEEEGKEKKLTTTYDIISGEFKEDIIRREEERVSKLTIDEIEKLLLDNEKYSYELIGKIDAFKSIDNLEENRRRYSRILSERIYINNGLKDLLLKLGIGQENIDKFINKLNIKEEDNDISDIRESYNELLGDDIMRLFNNITKKLRGDDITIIEDVGTVDRVYKEMKKELYETLKKEGIVDEDIEAESGFRYNVYMNMRNNLELRNIISIVEIIIATIYRILKDEKYNGLIDILNRIKSFENIYNVNNELDNISVISPVMMKMIIRLLCYKLIDSIIDNDMVFSKVIKYVIDMTNYNNKDNKSSEEVLKKIRADENVARKNMIKELPDDLRVVYGLSRALKTGEIIGIAGKLKDVITDDQRYFEEVARSSEVRKDLIGLVDPNDIDEGEEHYGDNDNEYDDI
jgi:hypothetical protein